MILKETYTLCNDVQIPKLGLGTRSIPDEQAADLQHMKDNAAVDFQISARFGGFENHRALSGLR